MQQDGRKYNSPRSLDGFVPNGPRRPAGFSQPSRTDNVTPRQHFGPSLDQRLRGASHHVPKPTSPVAGADFRRPQSQPQRRVADTADISLILEGEPEKRTTSRFRKDKKQKRQLKSGAKANWMRVIRRSILVVFALCLLTGGWTAWKAYRNVAKLTHNNNPFSLLNVFHPVPLKSQDGRVNVLIAGDSVDRTDGSGGGDLTDSIMILSLDTKNHNAFMLSVPRDLWVPIPGIGHQKINAAHTVTSFKSDGQYPNGGMGSLESVITTNLDIPINYYALVNYSAFRDLVNALGGVSVNIQSPDPRGLYDPQPYGGARAFKLPNGVQTLNGDQALNLARARGEAYGSYGFPHSDFDRTAHQRQLVLAIKDKASSASVIANPFKVGQLFDAIGNNVQTDLKLDEIETLYSLTKGINDNDIQSYNINDLISGKTLLTNYWVSGMEALAPAAGVDDFSQIQIGIKKLFSTDPMVKEGASVVVLNGGSTTGLARKWSDALTAKNASVAATADAPKNYPNTIIVDRSAGAKPATKQLLQSYFGSNVVASDPAATNYTADFIVILGNSQAAPASSSSSSNSTATTGQ